MSKSNILEAEEYEFIKTNEHLGKHVILLGLAGSYSYGTNNEGSDIDIRGITLNSKSDLIGLTSFSQYVDDKTDTTIYSLNKMVNLLIGCNPNTIELLGLNNNNYLFLNDIGRGLIEKSGMFLSKRAIQSFGGYADAQLRRLQNALARDCYPQREKEKHIYNSIKNAMHDFKCRYTDFDKGKIKLYVDKAKNPDFDSEIFMDVTLNHYPLRDYRSLWSEMNNIVKDYDKIGKRNNKKDDIHLNKHAMHLIRLLMMGIDILEKGEIITYRDKEHTLLMEIRNGKYQKDDGTYSVEFYEILEDYESRLEQAARKTVLPDEPDLFEIQKFVMEANERVVRDEI